MRSHDIPRFKKSLQDYDRWLAAHLDQMWQSDRRARREKMRASG